VRAELSETLTALVGAVPLDAPTEVVEVAIDVPLEISLVRRDGRPVLLAAPGHTRFTSGFLPSVHPVRIRVVRELDESSPWADAPEGWSR
jgi:hypothetical protein